MAVSSEEIRNWLDETGPGTCLWVIDILGEPKFILARNYDPTLGYLRVDDDMYEIVGVDPKIGMDPQLRKYSLRELYMTKEEAVSSLVCGNRAPATPPDGAPGVSQGSSTQGTDYSW